MFLLMTGFCHSFQRNSHSFCYHVLRLPNENHPRRSGLGFGFAATHHALSFHFVSFQFLSFSGELFSSSGKVNSPPSDVLLPCSFSLPVPVVVTVSFRHQSRGLPSIGFHSCQKPLSGPAELPTGLKLPSGVADFVFAGDSLSHSLLISEGASPKGCF